MDIHAGTIASPVPGKPILYRDLPNRSRPPEDPLGIIVAHIDAPMAHLHPKVFVPEFAMKGDTGLRDEKAGPGDSR